MRARTPAEKLDELLTLQARVEAEIKHTLHTIQRRTARRSRLVVPECGTETAYQRHHHRGEDIDDECKAAHRLHNRVKYAAAKYGQQEAS